MVLPRPRGLSNYEREGVSPHVDSGSLAGSTVVSVNRKKAAQSLVELGLEVHTTERARKTTRLFASGAYGGLDFTIEDFFPIFPGG